MATKTELQNGTSMAPELQGLALAMGMNPFAENELEKPDVDFLTVGWQLCNSHESKIYVLIDAMCHAATRKSTRKLRHHAVWYRYPGDAKMGQRSLPGR